uniref:Serpin B n=1 Tax=Rhipicephalus appendiculatus TaxID=34631 RepID=A0A131Z4E2_RHIAP
MDSQLGTSLMQFSVDLYKQLRFGAECSSNVFFSPFSVAASLSMVLAGARSRTAQQLRDALYVADERSHHRRLSGFLSEISGYAPEVRLQVANRIYCEREFRVLEDYLAFLRDSYVTSVESVDFRNEADKVRLEINDWVELVTSSKIRDLLPPGILNSSTVLVLVNAIYFKGVWKDQFDPLSTQPLDFHLDLNKKKVVDMMVQDNDYRMTKSAELKVTVLEVPYKGLKTSMLILLPEDVDGLEFLTKHVTSDNLNALVRNLRIQRDVELFLPKFTLEQSVTLNDVLLSLGVKDLFSQRCDLSGICETGGLMVTEVIHRAYVEVNEEGTEAAAATAVIVEECCLVSRKTRFVVNHPFMFLIMCNDPELVLFMGSVNEL